MNKKRFGFGKMALLVATLAGILMTTGCGMGLKDLGDIPGLEDLLGKDVTVTGVTVTAAGGAFTVQPGGTLQYSAVVNGENNPKQTVTWSIESEKDEGTTISSTGLLSVAEGELHDSLTIKATSTVDDTKSDTRQVFVLIPGAPLRLIVSAAASTVAGGHTVLFSSLITGEVEGGGSPVQTVNWSIITEGKHADTTLSGGLLTVSALETNESLTIQAASTEYPELTATAAVLVSNVTGVNLTAAGGATTIYTGQQLQFSAEVVGVNNPPVTTVTWTITTDNKHAQTTLSGGLLSVAAGETNSSLTIQAASTANPAISNSITVLVQRVTAIGVRVNNRSVQPGGTLTFTAEVEGVNNPDTTVTWSVLQPKHAGTNIDAGGILTVSAQETNTGLTIQAASTVTPGQTGTESVQVVTTPPVDTIEAVTITGDTTTMQRGQTRQFTAVVTGTGTPPQTVYWSIDGSYSAETRISSDASSQGDLVIGSGETHTSLTIRATSTANANISATHIVQIQVPPTATSVTIASEDGTLQNGQTRNFKATVSGINSPSQGVTWSIVGPHAVGTVIDTSGNLTIAANETYASLTVQAESTQTPGVSGTVTVTVVLPVVSTVTITGSTSVILPGQTRQFTATVNGFNYQPPQTVTWSFIGQHAAGTTINNGLLTVAADELNSSLIVQATSTYTLGKSATATVPVQLATVSSVTISGASIAVQPGETRQFTATVNGTHSPPQTVIWSIGKSRHVNTNFVAAANGGINLFVAAEETNPNLTIKAVSTFDPTKSQEVQVPVQLQAVMPGITISPASVAVERGQTRQFTAMVDGVVSQSVIWSIQETGLAAETGITPAGLLRVATNETKTSLTIRATLSGQLLVPPGTATVTIPPITVNGITINSPYDSILTTQQFTAQVLGTSSPLQGVTWSVAGAEHTITGATNISAEGLLTVAPYETEWNENLLVTATSIHYPAVSATKTVSISRYTVSTVYAKPSFISGTLDGIAVDGSGNMYISLTGSNTILKVVSGATTVIGGFNGPKGIAWDGTKLFIADSGNGRITKLDTGNLSVSNWAGSMNSPSDVAVELEGVITYKVIVADTNNHRIKRVSATLGFVEVNYLAGSDTPGFENGSSTVARFSSPEGVAYYPNYGGRIYVADTGNNSIRNIELSNGQVTTLAGSGTAGDVNGTGLAAQFNAPNGIAVFHDGLNANVYVTSRNSNGIRHIDVNRVVTTIAGNAGGGATGPDKLVNITYPRDVAVDSAGNIYVVQDNYVRKLTPAYP